MSLDDLCDPRSNSILIGQIKRMKFANWICRGGASDASNGITTLLKAC